MYRVQELVDLLHDRAENLIELQGRSERLTQFVENRNFARFAMFRGTRDCAGARCPKNCWFPSTVPWFN